MIKTLTYTGFTRNLCKCQYSIGKIDGKATVIFVQGPLGQTSITNVIEVLASKILASDLRGVAPGDVRFFEFYPPALKPMQVWQEVTFVESCKVMDHVGFIQKLWNLIQADEGPFYWKVDKPEWQLVPKDMEAKLKKLFPH